MGGLGGQGFTLTRAGGYRYVDGSAGSRRRPPRRIFTTLVPGHDGSQKTGDPAAGETDHPTSTERLRQLVQALLVPVMGGHVNVGRHSHHGATAGTFPNVRIWHIGKWSRPCRPCETSPSTCHIGGATSYHERIAKKKKPENARLFREPSEPAKRYPSPKHREWWSRTTRVSLRPRREEGAERPRRRRRFHNLSRQRGRPGVRSPDTPPG